ncbi:MAG: hypothetical protein IJ386_09195 [Clostridia bacterium]|nr:hypothetical protein [Clostridia bacterium]
MPPFCFELFELALAFYLNVFGEEREKPLFLKRGWEPRWQISALVLNDDRVVPRPIRLDVVASSAEYFVQSLFEFFGGRARENPFSKKGFLAKLAKDHNMFSGENATALSRHPRGISVPFS